MIENGFAHEFLNGRRSMKNSGRKLERLNANMLDNMKLKSENIHVGQWEVEVKVLANEFWPPQSKRQMEL